MFNLLIISVVSGGGEELDKNLINVLNNGQHP